MNDQPSLYKDIEVLKNQLTMNSVLLSRFFFFCFLSAFFVSYKSSFGPTSLSIARTKRLFLNVPHVFVVLFIIVKMFQCLPSAQRFEFMTTSHKIFYAIRSGFGILTQHPSYRLLNKKFVAARSS